MAIAKKDKENLWRLVERVLVEIDNVRSECHYAQQATEKLKRHIDRLTEEEGDAD